MIVFLDLDGTIIGASGGVSEVLEAALAQSRDAGIDFRVCTGRTCAGVAEETAAFLNPTGHHIFESGAVAIVPITHKVLFADSLLEDDVRRLVEHARQLPAALELYTTNGVFVEEATEDVVAHSECLRMPFTVRNFDDVIAHEVVLRGHWIARAETFEDALNVELPGAYVATAGSPALPDLRFASVTLAGTSKGRAVERVLANAGVHPSESYGIGDTMGDLSMLEMVGHPRVMANSDPPLLERFVVIPSVSEDGVAHFLQELALLGTLAP